MAANKSIEPAKAGAQVYMIGALVGLIGGLLGAYLYARAAQDEIARGGQPPRVQTMQILTLLLAAMGLMRQIAEMGKTPKK
jgi:NhaP-type Na+/H+ or K+/H+ antiporter